MVVRAAFFGGVRGGGCGPLEDPDKIFTRLPSKEEAHALACVSDVATERVNLTDTWCGCVWKRSQLWQRWYF